jgi:hypothetical protein
MRCDRGLHSWSISPGFEQVSSNLSYNPAGIEIVNGHCHVRQYADRRVDDCAHNISGRPVRRRRRGEHEKDGQERRNKTRQTETQRSDYLFKTPRKVLSTEERQEIFGFQNVFAFTAPDLLGHCRPR